MCTQAIYSAMIRVIKQRTNAWTPKISSRTHIDIGAGSGTFIQQLRNATSINSYACDLYPEAFELADVTCTRVDINCEPLPYPANQFDVVTASEVIEHLENFRDFLREAFRVTAPGGIILITTPNVLNMKSRLRYLFLGFPSLFGPLPIHNRRVHTLTEGHISPIPYFYIAHALMEAGFEQVNLDIDRAQKTSIFMTLICAPFLFIGKYLFVTCKYTRYKTITSHNTPLVASHFSWPLLVGRTAVVSALKPTVTKT
jgi:ubiquinone/menaquinone biosynthesis C-methylase UbiE